MDIVQSIKGNKLLLYGLPIAAIMGAYVLYKNSQANASAGPAGTVTQADNSSAFAAALGSVGSALETQNSQIGSGLAALVNASNQGIVKALGTQTTGLEGAFGQTQAAISAVAQAEDQAFSDLYTTMKLDYSTLSDQIGQQLTQLYNAVNPQLQSIASSVAAGATATNQLASDTQSEALLQFGLDTAAACWNNGLGQFNHTCIGGKIVDWTGEFSDQQAAAKYQPCKVGDHYDLVCVGRMVQNQFSGGGLGSH